MGIAENIDALMLRLDVNADGLARLVGVAPSTVGHWRKGAKPRPAQLQTLKEKFDLTEDDLLSDLVGIAAQDHGKYIPPIKNAIPARAGSFSPVPLRSRVHAGKQTEADDLSGREETVDIPDYLIQADHDTYCAIVEGDCMDKVYPEGCVIAISPNRQPQNGSVAVVTIDDMDTVMRKMYKTAHTLVLSPESTNPNHKDIVIQDGDDHVVEFGGKVVWFQSNGEME